MIYAWLFCLASQGIGFGWNTAKGDMGWATFNLAMMLISFAFACHSARRRRA